MLLSIIRPLQISMNIGMWSLILLLTQTAKVQAALSARCLADDSTLFENNPGLANARNLVQELESTYINNCFSGTGSGSSCTISLDAVDDTFQTECTAAGAKYLVCDYVMFCSSFGLSFDFTHAPECWASSCQDGNLESYTDLLYRDIADDLNLSLDAGCVIDTNDVNCAVVNRAPPIVTDPEEAINIDEGKRDFNVGSSSSAVSYGFVGSLVSVVGVIVAASLN